MGPTFTYPFIFYRAKGVDDIRHNIRILRNICWMFKWADILMFFSGMFLYIAGGWASWHLNWINIAIILFILMKTLSNICVAKSSKVNRYATDATVNDDELVTIFETTKRKTLLLDVTVPILTFSVLILMHLKPF
ncbi:DUF2269 family protein [Paenibacillus cremeus]|uniref:DUF2269 family protein n=2 Tax=Paenibacillus cremeus TaxID=2163881 RepID=A0A559KE23_9BACL|nr:DUF2269 family protein [Paenibacillus cremeus]